MIISYNIIYYRSIPLYIYLYLVGGLPTPPKKSWSSSIGIMTFHSIPNCFWKVIIQPCSKPPVYHRFSMDILWSFHRIFPWVSPEISELSLSVRTVRSEWRRQRLHLLLVGQKGTLLWALLGDFMVILRSFDGFGSDFMVIALWLIGFKCGFMC